MEGVAVVVSDNDDIALLRAHVRGDRDAFNELVRRHQDRLWAVALRTLGNPDDAADALQEGLLAAFRNAASFRGDAAVTTWLHRIVVNACFDRMRARRRRPVSALPAELPDNRDPIEQSDTTVSVQAALATLPIEQRAAIVLVDVCGCSVDEAARVLDVPVGTVKSRCARGRARLAVSLGHVPEPRNQPRSGDVGPVDGEKGAGSVL